ncbi:hypothetical protein K438DRAFT_1795315 [Mycena galopus ATCC 62051]|nr:hypothetical protein K438DRAFT_1795315 [Mycena galopus ATCC 62051]
MILPPHTPPQSRVARRTEKLDALNCAEVLEEGPQSQTSSMEIPASIKAKRRQGVSDLRIPPLALFSLGTVDPDPSFTLTHCPSDSESGDGEEQVFEFPQPPRSGLEAGAFFSRSPHSHSAQSSFDSSSTPESSRSRSECSSPTSSGPPATPTSPTHSIKPPLRRLTRGVPVKPLFVKKRTPASPCASSSSVPLSPPFSLCAPSHPFEVEDPDAADDEYYAAHARALVTLPRPPPLPFPLVSASSAASGITARPSTAPSSMRAFRESGAIPRLPSTTTCTAQGTLTTPARPRRPPPPPPVASSSGAPSASASSSASASAPAPLTFISPSNPHPPPTSSSFHLRNSHIHPASASYSRTRFDARVFEIPFPQASSSSSSRHSHSHSTSTSSSTSMSTSSSSHPHSHPYPSRPRAGTVPNFSRPTSLALLSITPTCRAPDVLDASGSKGTLQGEDEDEGKDREDSGDSADFAADYAAYAPLLRTPTPASSPRAVSVSRVSRLRTDLRSSYLGGTRPTGLRGPSRDGDREGGEADDDYVDTDEEGGVYDDGAELSPLIAPAPSPLPFPVRKSECSSQDDDDDDERAYTAFRPLASESESSSSSSCAPPASPPPQAPQPKRSHMYSPPPSPSRQSCDTAETAPAPTLGSRWSSSTLSSQHSAHMPARTPKTKPFSFARRYLPRASGVGKAPKGSAAANPRPIVRPMGCVTVLPPPPKRRVQRDGDYGYGYADAGSRSGSSTGWSYAGSGSPARSMASPSPFLAASGRHSAHSSVSVSVSVSGNSQSSRMRSRSRSRSDASC